MGNLSHRSHRSLFNKKRPQKRRGTAARPQGTKAAFDVGIILDNREMGERMLGGLEMAEPADWSQQISATHVSLKFSSLSRQRPPGFAKEILQTNYCTNRSSYRRLSYPMVVCRLHSGHHSSPLRPSRLLALSSLRLLLHYPTIQNCLLFSLAEYLVMLLVA